MTRHLRLVTDAETDLDARIARRTTEIVDELKATGGWELRRALNSSELVACPQCKAWPGAACRTSGGWVLADDVHAGRRNAIARMSADERIETYAREKAAREISKADSDAHMSRPEVRARIAVTQAAVSERLDAMREQQWAAEREMRRRCNDPYRHRTGCTCRIDTEGATR